MMRVLLVEDDALTIDLTGLFFEAEGWAFGAVSAWDEIEPAIAKTRPDILVLGLESWDDGQRLEGLMQDEQVLNLPVVLLSERRDSGSIEQAFNLGVKDYLHKPFMPAELVARCHWILTPVAA